MPAALPHKKRILVTVISDLVTDQRVHKVCQTLHDNGYTVKLTGMQKKNSLPLGNRDYATHRIPLIFQQNVWMYAEVNIRLFFYLLFQRAHILLGNDLDVMPATWLAATLRQKPVVYDTHEYYLGMPELDGKPRIKKVWQQIEQFIFPRLRHIYTICDSFCALYHRDYGKTLRAVRNVPYLHPAPVSPEKQQEIEQQTAPLIPKNKKLLLFQGAGINPERGGEELVQAMQWLDPDTYHLLIVGGGLSFEQIRKMVEDLQLQDRITIIPKVPFEVLRYITRQAHLGLSLDKPTNINHIYGLPNKIFDYLHSGVPVLTSRLVEMEKIIDTWQVGGFIENHDPQHIAQRIRDMLARSEQWEQWRQNTVAAREALNWEREGQIVLEIFKQVEAASR